MFIRASLILTSLFRLSSILTKFNMISFPDSLFNRMGHSSHFEYGFFSRLPFLPTSVLASNSSTLPPTSLLPPWKEWLLISINDISRWFHGKFWTILHQVIDLMEKVTKEQSKESTKTNGSFFGSWSWTVELHWSWAQKLPNKVTNMTRLVGST